TESWTVTVDDVIETATFTIDAIADANVDENNTYTSVTPSLSGDDPIGTITYTLGGSDASNFTVDSSTGVVSMITRDFENPEDDDTNNVYELTITATDSDGNEDTESWAVSINDLDDESGDGDVEIIVIDDDANNITITPSNAEDVDVGTTTLNVEKEKAFEIRNTGQIPIEVFQIILSDSNFVVTNFPPLIEVNESSEITIVLLATQTGTFSSTVEIITSIGSILFVVMGEVINLPTIVVKNVVTPNGDGKHDFLRIENIEFYPNNKVEIFNRTGSMVFSIENYNNSDRVFTGIANTKSSQELISGNYYYTVKQGKNKLGVGFLLLQR
ncbi:MAG: gliding motility-associated C-terminal domain-containing protein, partial [bacterium]|nr:gliding motility-associated C-terminal domain-containing protein [bacterium]